MISFGTWLYFFFSKQELAEKNLALEKEKKSRLKAETKLKELTGQRKYDPSEAFKVMNFFPLDNGSSLKLGSWFCLFYCSLFLS